MNKLIIQKTEVEKDPGVIVQKKLTWREQAERQNEKSSETSPGKLLTSQRTTCTIVTQFPLCHTKNVFQSLQDRPQAS